MQWNEKRKKKSFYISNCVIIHCTRALTVHQLWSSWLKMFDYKCVCCSTSHINRNQRFIAFFFFLFMYRWFFLLFIQYFHFFSSFFVCTWKLFISFFLLLQTSYELVKDFTNFCATCYQLYYDSVYKQKIVMMHRNFFFFIPSIKSRFILSLIFFDCEILRLIWMHFKKLIEFFFHLPLNNYHSNKLLKIRFSKMIKTE